MKRMFLATALAGVLVSAPAAAQVTLQMVEVITSPQRTELVQQMIGRFEAANPGVTVELTSLPWGQAFEKLATMVQGGQIPDVVEMPDSWMALYGNAGQLVDLGPYMADWADGETITSRATEVGSLVNDTPYMIPYGFYLRAFFYNKSLFAQAGLDGPPQTMDDFMADAAAITALGGGKTGYCLRGSVGGSNGWFMMMANMMGSNEFFDENGNSLINTPEAIQGIQFILDLYQNGYASRDSVNWGFNEIVSGFYSGNCAMLDQDPDALIAIAERMDPEDFAVAPLPLGPHNNSFPTIGYAGWSMFSASEHKDEAWALISHLSSPAENLEWAKFVGVIPIHTSAIDDPYFATEQFAGWFIELTDPRWTPTILPAHLEEWGYFVSVFGVETAQEALLGDISAEELADQWAEYFTDAQQKWLASQ